MRCAGPLLLMGTLLACGCSKSPPAALAPQPSSRVVAVAPAEAPRVLQRNPMSRRKLIVSRVQPESASRLQRSSSTEVALRPTPFTSETRAVTPSRIEARRPATLIPASLTQQETGRHLSPRDIIRRLDQIHERTAAEIRRTNTPELRRMVERGHAEQERVRARGRQLLEPLV